MYNGIINIYKEKGFTSFDVVAKLRGILHQRKIGHTGTLDPEAEGVLPVCLGNGTGLCALLTDRDKEYEAVMRLGTTTDTQDMTGTVLREHPVAVSEGELQRAIQSFVGAYDQIPPMYSALKQNGQKLYELARRGIVVDRPARRVTIHEIQVLRVALPLVTMRVRCSKGTYIRTLCEDIGNMLGCGGCMESLLRTSVAQFTLENAYRLRDVEQAAADGRLDDLIAGADTLFPDYRKVHPADAAAERGLANGNRLSATQLGVAAEWVCMPEYQFVRVYGTDGRFMAVYGLEPDCASGSMYKPVKMFLPE